jgi:DNA-binding CsgD family transcriptional regulator
MPCASGWKQTGPGTHSTGNNRSAPSGRRWGQVTRGRPRSAAMSPPAEHTGNPGARQSRTPSRGSLSARERELVTLVAQGATNAQIAAQLYISVRTVSSHLDRIRDKTGCRRRADLTRLALTEGLI